MIEITDEMIADGVAAWLDVGGGSTREHLTAAYRAMRAHEPKPVDRVARRPFGFNEEEEITPKLRNRQAPPPAKSGDPGMRAEDQARGFNSTEWGANAQAVYNPTQGGGGDGGFRPGEYVVMPPLDRLAVAEIDRRLTALERGKVDEQAKTEPYADWNATSPIDRAEKRLNRRIDALTALVLLMVGGYQPHNGHEHEELKRLLAELEPTR